MASPTSMTTPSLTPTTARHLPHHLPPSNVRTASVDQKPAHALVRKPHLGCQDFIFYNSGKYTCSLSGSTVLGLDFGVETEEECAQLCWDTKECTFYSYYSLESSPLQLACAKLSECLDPATDPAVVSGPADCTDIGVAEEVYPLCYTLGSSWVDSTPITIPSVLSADACQSYCLNSSTCISFSWHKGSAGFPSQTCELFVSIGEPSPCEDCVSGPKSCTCSGDYSCTTLGETLVDLMFDVLSEEACQDICARTSQCTWYTWYSGKGKTCALLTQCNRPEAVEDGTVKSGAGDCSNQEIRPAPCLNYDILDSFTRNIKTPSGDAVRDACGSRFCSDGNSTSHHPDWKGEGWYRFMGEAGTRMALSPPNLLDPENSDNHCGTAGTYWMSGTLPTPEENEVVRTAYYQYGGGSPLAGPVDVTVLNCGPYYVYNLVNVLSSCGYCGE